MILAGCGHAHLEVVRMAASFMARSTELLLVDPGLFWYSGRGSGLLGGRFEETEATVDTQALARACGARHLNDRLAGIDRSSKTAVFRSGARIGYDLLSLNIGSHVQFPAGIAGQVGSGSVTPVKPIAGLPGLRTRILASGRGLRIVVLGAGATGCEIAGNLLHLSASRDLGIGLTLIGASPDLLPGAPAGIRRRAWASLSRRGAALRLGSKVEGAGAGVVRLDGGERIPFDRIIVATGLAADPLVATLDLPHQSGGLRVGRALQSIGDASVFAAGDCAALEGRDLAKVGVYGVRAGPVLARNLLAALDGRPLEPFRPQRRYLSILDLADGEGLAMRGDAWFAGRSALWLKNHLDRRFLERYRGTG